MPDLLGDWLVSPGHCLVCGGRGGWTGPGVTTTVCLRCGGTGRDPDRATDWYIDGALPIQLAAINATRHLEGAMTACGLPEPDWRLMDPLTRELIEGFRELSAEAVAQDLADE